MSQLLNRIRGEYDEMPDLKLTSWQACRLWNLAAPVCDSMLETLVSERFLVRTRDGAYLRESRAPASSSTAHRQQRSQRGGILC